MTEEATLATEAKEVHPEGAAAAEGQGDDANGASPVPPEPANGQDATAPALSRSKLKKLKKQELYAERKLYKRQQEKKRKQEAKAARTEQIKQVPITEEELQEKLERRDALVAARRKANEEKRTKLQEALQSGQKIVIDLEFADYMRENELKSLCQQLQYSYSSNGKASVPAHLILTGLKGTMEEVVHRQIGGFGNWLVTTSESSYMDHFKDATDQLVYLTADSEHELQELDPSKAYIIGGIVDRNRHKGLCFNKANDQGIATARLPIGEYLELSSSKVMCTNHVVDIMLRWMDLKDWESAFKAVIPTRKRKAGEEEERTTKGVEKE